MMEITRKVILDLLPLYLAGEVSDDTRALVEQYLETDQELAALTKSPDSMEIPQDIPISLTEADKMKAYRKTRWLMILTILCLSILIALALGAMFYAFFVSA